jgi:hypothetical protein
MFNNFSVCFNHPPRERSVWHIPGILALGYHSRCLLNAWLAKSTLHPRYILYFIDIYKTANYKRPMARSHYLTPLF